MATIKELREQAASTLTEARSMLDSIDDNATPEQRAEAEQAVDKALDEVSQIEARAERVEKLEAAEKRAAEMADRAEREAREAKKPIPGAKEAETSEMDYRTAFHAWLRSKQEDGEPLSAEARAVLRQGYDKIEKRAQTTTNAAGGYSIPEQMLNEITVSMLAYGPMYDPGVTREIVTTGGNPMPWPTVDDTSSTAEPHTEGATLTDDSGKDVVFGTKQLDAFAFDTEWLRISKELMDDSFLAVEALIGSLLGERLGRIANLQLTTGTGSGAPNGIVTASGAGVTAASATAITSDEIIDLEHSVDPAYRSNPGVAFMMNDSTLQTVRKLKDGDGNYLWQMGNVQSGVPATLLGRRIVINQQVPSIATGNRTMLFGDMQKYFVRKVGQPLIGAISDKDFWPGVGVAGYIRFDGEMADAGAIKHLVQA